MADDIPHEIQVIIDRVLDKASELIEQFEALSLHDQVVLAETLSTIVGLQSAVRDMNG